MVNDEGTQFVERVVDGGVAFGGLAEGGEFGGVVYGYAGGGGDFFGKFLWCGRRNDDIVRVFTRDLLAGVPRHSGVRVEQVAGFGVDFFDCFHRLLICYLVY